jgi:hypothetical protein
VEVCTEDIFEDGGSKIIEPLNPDFPVERPLTISPFIMPKSDDDAVRKFACDFFEK